MSPNHHLLRVWFATMALSVCGNAAIITNGGFETGLGGWRPLWTRDANVGTLTLDSSTVHSGKKSARIEHRGEKDWSLEPALRLPVQAGDVFELEAWLKLDGHGGSVTLCASTHDAQGKALDWSHGERSLHDTADWQRLRTRFIVPPGVVQIQPRLIGNGALTVWMDDLSLVKTGNVNAMRGANLPACSRSRTLSLKSHCEFHLKENGSLLGQGKVDFKRVREALEDIGYEGWMQIEGAMPRGGNIPESYTANYKFLRNLFPE